MWARPPEKWLKAMSYSCWFSWVHQEMLPYAYLESHDLLATSDYAIQGNGTALSDWAMPCLGQTS